MIILKNILQFITDPKNTRMLLLGIAVVFLFLFLQQCDKNKDLKNGIELEKQESKRVLNNYKAALDTIEQGKIDENTWRAEKTGYELTLKEVEKKFDNLLGDFVIEKNKPPKVLVKTEYLIKESINDVPILIKVDSNGNKSLIFRDSVNHNASLVNYRILNGEIPYKIIFDSLDSTYKAVPSFGKFELSLGMNLNLGLFQDKKTKKISILVDTDYPGVIFTSIEGASIMDDPANKKILRKMRKNWGIGFNVGYGAIVDIDSGIIDFGPYVGIGISYTPKFLQWGK